MISQEEFLQRIVGRLEGAMRYKPEQVTQLKEKILEAYNGISSQRLRCNKTVIELTINDHSIAFPPCVFLVAGYNDFNLENEFGKTY